MTQFKRVGHDFTMEFADTPSPEFWEPVAPEVTPAASTPASAAQPETSK